MINLDWLSFSVKLHETEEEKYEHKFTFNTPPRCKMVEYGGTNIYGRRLIYFSEQGEKILTVLCEPLSKIIDRESCLIEVANRWLYSSLHWLWDFVQKIHSCCFQCLSRIDVCYDFENREEQQRIIDGLSDNSIYIAGKKEGSQFYDYYDRDGVARKARCLSWGSKHSNLKWKLYNKTLEIHDTDVKGMKYCNKPYIKDLWEKCGYDTNIMWRLEVSITSASKFKFLDDTMKLGDVTKGDYISKLFESLYMTRFVQRRNQGHKDRTNDKREYLLPKGTFIERLEIKEPLTERQIVEYASCLRSAMTQLDRDEVKVNPQMLELWKTTAINCVYIGRLEGYLYRTYGCTIEDIELM